MGETSSGMTSSGAARHLPLKGEAEHTPPMPPGLYNMDCMEAMRQFPDKFFDLAVVDPPYGDAGMVNNSIGGGTVWRDLRPLQNPGTDSARGSTGTRCQNLPGGTGQGPGPARTGGTWAEKYGKKIIAWDVAPGEDYFKELFRVSRNQIIWGGNYFDLPPCRCFLIWNKLIPESFSMAMVEYAWTSFNSNAKMYAHTPQGTAKEQRFHPTQKPVALYEWILQLYAKPGMKILDTHAGSASSLVACHRAGLDAWGYEIDETYYTRAKVRLETEKAQVSIMDLMRGGETFDQLEIALAE